MNDSVASQERAPSPIVITHSAGGRFTAEIGPHELTLDQPLRGGGSDTGPSPLDLLGAALGGCVALYVHRFLEARGVTDAGLRVEVTQHSARTPHRIARFAVEIDLPAEVPILYIPLIEATARVCPAYNTLVRAAEITIAVHTPAAIR